MKKLNFKTKMALLILLFSVLGYILGCFMHSEFFHHFDEWLFGG